MMYFTLCLDPTTVLGIDSDHQCTLRCMLTAKTLVDTGSPATIISLKFVMGIMVGERKEDQSREQWKVDTLNRLALPDVSLKNYGGHPLNIIAQTPLRLSHGGQTVDATVLIQKEAQTSYSLVRMSWDSL